MIFYLNKSRDKQAAKKYLSIGVSFSLYKISMNSFSSITSS
ncbi:hypothetical protein FH5_00275 [Priestia endophytica]|nr:hypothetical protein FH5_00275 [Priestia endophytica]